MNFIEKFAIGLIAVSVIVLVVGWQWEKALSLYMGV